MSKLLYDPQTEEPYFIAGDPEDKFRARGNPDDPTGMAAGYRFHKMGEANPQIRYKDFLLTCDMYISPDKSEMQLVLICPRCMNQLRISSKDKDMHWDPEKGISISPFRCSWEIGRGTDGTADDRIAYGLGLCNWSVGVENGVAKDH